MPKICELLTAEEYEKLLKLITTEKDLAEGVAKLAALNAGEDVSATVTPIRSAGSA